MKSMLHAGERLRPSARTLWELQQKAGRLPAETKSGLYLHALREAEKCLEVGDRRRESVRDMASLRKYQSEARGAFFDCLGFVPDLAQGAYSRARFVSRIEKDCFNIEKILLEPREGSFASANVYVPVCAAPPYPAVLITVGHDDRGKADPEYQYLAQRLVHMGILCLVLDPVGQGERFEHYDAKTDCQPIQGCSGEHDLLDWKAKLLGQCLAGYFIQDGLCALDYLSERPDVDAKRIGLTGHSGGGTQVSLLMMAAGERFACAAPCAYVTDNRAMLECGVDPDNEMLWPGSLAAGLDYVDFLAGMAPKPVLLLTDRHDFFPREGTLRTLEKAKTLWKKCGSDNAIEIATAENQHGYPAALAEQAVRFFGRNLALHAASDTSDFCFEPLSPETLACTPSGQLLKEFPAMRTVHADLIKECDRLCAFRNTLSLNERIEGFKHLIHFSDLSSAPEPRVYDEGICGEYLYRCMVWRTPDGLINSGLLLRARQSNDAPLPTLIALWPEGTRRIAEYSNRLHRMVLNGWQVLILDMTASGALLPNVLASTDMHMGWSTMYILNAYLIQLGDSIFSLHVREIASALKMLKNFEEVKQGSTSIYAQGELSRCAEVAALLTGTKIFSDNDFEDWEDIVREPFHDQTNTYAWAQPGALKYFNSAEISLLVHDTLKIDDPTLKKP